MFSSPDYSYKYRTPLSLCCARHADVTRASSRQCTSARKPRAKKIFGLPVISLSIAQRNFSRRLGPMRKCVSRAFLAEFFPPRLSARSLDRRHSLRLVSLGAGGKQEYENALGDALGDSESPVEISIVRIDGIVYNWTCRMHSEVRCERRTAIVSVRVTLVDSTWVQVGWQIGTHTWLRRTRVIINAH